MFSILSGIPLVGIGTGFVVGTTEVVGKSVLWLRLILTVDACDCDNISELLRCLFDHQVMNVEGRQMYVVLLSFPPSPQKNVKG